jgi:DNA-binding transcriptional LysR family regulator
MAMKGIDLNDVAAFVRVAEDGGFTAAARALRVPKSTVSRALARLEGALDVRLVQRTTRSFALTDAGRAYYERVRGAVAQVAEASADASDRSDSPRGTIRVTAPVDLGEAFLAAAIVAFVEKYPEVHFDVSLTSRVVDLVAEGFDLALRASPMADSSLVVRKLGQAHMGFFASPAYLARKGEPARVEDLAGHDFVLFRAAGIRNPLPLIGPGGEERALIVPEGSAIAADDLTFVNAAVAAGAGIGLLPIFFASCEASLQRAGLTRILPDWRMRGAPLHLVAPGGSGAQEPRRVRLFRDFLVAEAKRRGFGG